MRNDLKKKATQIVEEEYQMASLSERSRIALATWLCQYVTLGDKKGARDNVIRIPRFICPVEMARDKKRFVTEDVSIMSLLLTPLGDDVTDGYSRALWQ